MRELEQEALLAARSDAKVLITGESGVGKELIAHLIHAQSALRAVPLVTINCAGIPETLLETELFGHTRGSFTDAYRDKPGRLKVADKGTIFMDEIGEMTGRMQSLLLRFLETGEIQPVGALAPLCRVDVRVICATNRNLEERVNESAFRADLYYRLNVIHLIVPPLRERLEDIQVLLHHFRDLYCARYRRPHLRFAPETLCRLEEYTWPGNVRELKNIVERLVVRSRNDVLKLSDLPGEVRYGAKNRAAGEAPPALTRADELLDRMISSGESFWAAVYQPFIERDITREDIRLLVQRGLERTRGNYRVLVDLFNMSARDYRRFLNFLRKHNCHQPFRQFRVPVRDAVKEQEPFSSREPASRAS